MHIWTDTKRKKLQCLIRKGVKQKEIAHILQLPGTLGKHCLSNAIKRYTTAQDRQLGHQYRHHKTRLQPKLKEPQHPGSSCTVTHSLRFPPEKLILSLSDDEQEAALNSPESLPSFHPLTWNSVMQHTPLPAPFQALRPWSLSESDHEILSDDALIQYLEQGNI